MAKRAQKRELNPENTVREAAGRREVHRMWYAAQVRTGTEELIKLQCERVLPDTVMKECCIPYYERMRRYEGEWHLEQKTLFPGYVFLVSDEPEALFRGLKKIIGLTKLIGTGREVVPLTEKEIAWIQRLGNDEGLVKMSRGVVEGDDIVITDGPLEGLEGYIRRIDRHKRIACLEIEMMGRVVETRVGLEVVIKR